MIDRMIITLLVGPLKADFGLSDTQVSLLHGLAFTLLYVIIGLPMGWLTDRYSRRWIAGLSVASWSLMTALCGIASNYTQLFLARMGVGIGEAGISPAANSMIADYFPATRLSLPITLYSVGGSGGIGLALIFGGTIIDYVNQLGRVVIPFVGEIPGWQVSFIIAGLPGLVVAAAFVFVKEPPRQGKQSSDNRNAVSVGETWLLLKSKRSFLLPHFCAAAACALVILSIHAWMPTHLMRTFGFTAGEAGFRYGLAVLIGGVSGLILSGWAANRISNSGRSDSSIVVALGCTIIAIVPSVFAPLVSNAGLSIILSGIAVLGFAAAIALAPVALPLVVPNEMRGQVYALYLLTISVLGYAVGPVVVALITDHIFQNDAMVGRSMSAVAVFAGPLAVLFWAHSRRQFGRSMFH